jgi:FkbM family methyltransferase
MPDRVETLIPGRDPIELVAFYEEFRSYYPLCELETKRWFVEHIRPDWWVFDVGANIGYYTILFAQLAPQGRVFAFEPTTTAAMLRTNLRHNAIANAEVHEIALGAVSGERQDRIFRLWGGEGEVKYYPFYRLDDFVAEHKIERVDCIKIDVDSFDFEVLRGAEQTLLKNNPVIVIELNDALAKRNQHASEALAWLAARGYARAVVLDHDNFMLQRGSEAFDGLDGHPRLELLFPPPRPVTERMPPSAGTPIGTAFIRSAELHNDAVARAAEGALPTSLAAGLARTLESARDWLMRRPARSPGSPVPLPVDGLAGLAIETPSNRWSYALVLAFDGPAADETLTVEFEVEVIQGALGIAACAEDISRLVPPEWSLSAMPGRQSVVIRARGPGAGHVVFRNLAPDGTTTVFRVSGIAARRGVPDPNRTT